MGSIETMIAYFIKGGWVMWPLLFASIFVVAVAIERFLYYKSAVSTRSFIDEYCSKAMANDLAGAKSLASSSTGLCAHILANMPQQANKAELESYFSARATIAIAGLRSRLNYLSVITTLAPLLGLLGTIMGMISAFSIFDLKEGAPIAITGGIGEALIATATGLCIAILSLVVHSYFESQMDGAITDMEQCFGVTLEAVSRGK